MQDLNLLLVQTDTRWEDIPANLNNISSLLERKSADIIVLPETFSTGFTMNSKKLAESMDGKAVSWMNETAKKFNAVVTGSLIISDGEDCFNRLVWVEPSGRLDFYDKRHLIALMGEDKSFSRGFDRKIFNYKGWRICPQVCYDLRFPVWSRNQDDYDALIYVANWPVARHVAWRTLLHARAIENQAYVAAVNRVGKDGNGLEFGGGSLCIDPLGETILEADNNQIVSSVTFKAENLSAIRAKLPFLRDRDHFSIKTL